MTGAVARFLSSACFTCSFQLAYYANTTIIPILQIRELRPELHSAEAGDSMTPKSMFLNQTSILAQVSQGREGEVLEAGNN